ncbi:MAG: hypothetical protein FWD68_17255 [Alphaproteobacteria bacterium]|nr:hypothetical protein [Alphaproteobacteria bacterium]
MAPDTAFVLMLVLRMALTALLVVTASIMAERSGPVIGALIATLPISAGPAYVFLSLDHDALFIAEAARTSLAINTATLTMIPVYVLVAQRHGTFTSCTAAVAAWVALAVGLRQIQWSLVSALLLNAAVLAISLPLLARYRHVAMPPMMRRWTDIPLRAALVALVVAAVVAASRSGSPALSGVIAPFPIVLISVMVIFHPRAGGPFAAAVIANSSFGLVGFGLAVAVLQITAARLGSAIGLSLALATAVTWNLGLWWQGMRRRLAAQTASRR